MKTQSALTVGDRVTRSPRFYKSTTRGTVQKVATHGNGRAYARIMWDGIGETCVELDGLQKVN
jgi:hypothetical protein